MHDVVTRGVPGKGGFGGNGRVDRSDVRFGSGFLSVGKIPGKGDEADRGENGQNRDDDDELGERECGKFYPPRTIYRSKNSSRNGVGNFSNGHESEMRTNASDYKADLAKIQHERHLRNTALTYHVGKYLLYGKL